MEGLIPTRSEMLYLSFGIGVDWNVEQGVSHGSGTTGGIDSANYLFNEHDLTRADLDLWSARRLLIPTARIGAALRIPTSRQPVWLQLFVRQAFLDSYELPVAVTVRENFFTRHQLLVSQRPTYFGLSASYFF